MKNFDYSENGLYFLTICVKNRKKLLCNIVGRGVLDAPKIELTSVGEIVEKYIHSINNAENLSVEKYVIMPDHIHLLLRIHCDSNGLPTSAPKINKVIQQTKGIITKQIGFSIWQKSYNDHIVRGLDDYKNIWEYIENNPLK